MAGFENLPGDVSVLYYTRLDCDRCNNDKGRKGVNVGKESIEPLMLEDG